MRRVFPARRAQARANWAWAGDECADDALRAATFRELAGDSDPASWTSVVEFGPGSGKYTELLLSCSRARVTAYEISPAFLELLNERCATEVRADAWSLV